MYCLSSAGYLPRLISYTKCMRINKYLAQATDLSRRSADKAIEEGRVLVNGQTPTSGQNIAPSDMVSLDNKAVTITEQHTTIMLNKPTGYVCSRDGQDSKTIYELLPAKYQSLNSIGRLDKDSSGLLILTNNGQLTQKLAHPSNQKNKVYQVTLNKTLEDIDRATVENGVKIDDYLSIMRLSNPQNNNSSWTVTMNMGRNRQIRRTFETLGYKVTKLHRTGFGDYLLNGLASSKIKIIN